MSPKDKKSICLIREVAVQLTPEEEVRQNLLSWMIQEGGYPKGLISVEKELPGFDAKHSRRLDILIYRPNTLTPLLLVECKAKRLTSKALYQLMGYNVVVKAPFLLLASKEQVRLGSYKKESGWVFTDKLPLFSSLC